VGGRVEILIGMKLPKHSSQ